MKTQLLISRVVNTKVFAGLSDKKWKRFVYGDSARADAN